ncbi:hypothetical protein [Castellaniella sp.]|uniref:hypothetical protein n=1 Tax=Castellaniella sp. TaxID=1955812 RepID=UPI002AFED19E|nr:hypothetical protein [Castellaniella sp.]
MNAMDRAYPIAKIVVVNEVDGAFAQKQELKVPDAVAKRHQDARWSVVDRRGAPMRMALLGEASSWSWDPKEDASPVKFESLLLHHVRATLNGTTLYVFVDNPQQAPTKVTAQYAPESAHDMRWGSW